MLPLSLTISLPKREITCLKPGVSGSTTWRANSSDRITTAPLFENKSATVLFPAPMPPVNPTFMLAFKSELV